MTNLRCVLHRFAHFILNMLFLTALGQLAACSGQQAYGAGQSWQRNECNKINDNDERHRCMESASVSHDEYRRQQEAVKGSR